MSQKQTKQTKQTKGRITLDRVVVEQCWHTIAGSALIARDRMAHLSDGSEVAPCWFDEVAKQQSLANELEKFLWPKPCLSQQIAQSGLAWTENFRRAA